MHVDLGTFSRLLDLRLVLRALEHSDQVFSSCMARDTGCLESFVRGVSSCSSTE